VGSLTVRKTLHCEAVAEAGRQAGRNHACMQQVNCVPACSSVLQLRAPLAATLVHPCPLGSAAATALQLASSRGLVAAAAKGLVDSDSEDDDLSGGELAAVLVAGRCHRLPPPRLLLIILPAPFTYLPACSLACVYCHTLTPSKPRSTSAHLPCRRRRQCL
jgi:hypothetical protein